MPVIGHALVGLARGESYEALGEPAIAERYFLRAYEKDPTNFWAVADLAEFHAASNTPAADRRRAVEPYVEELKRNFPRHRRLNEVLARIDQKLGEREE